MRAGLPLKVEGGNVQLRAASSAAARSKVGPSELVIQTFPFSSTIANTRTVPTTLWVLAADGKLGVTRFVSRPLSEPALTSCGSGAAGALVAAIVGATCAGAASVFSVAGAGLVAKGFGIRFVTASRAGDLPSDATWIRNDAIFSRAIKYSVCHLARSSSFRASECRIPSTSS